MNITMIESKGTNKSADRTLSILEAFADRRQSLTLAELAEHCAIPVSTCHSLVHTLLARAYLYQTSRRKHLYPTRRLLDLAAEIVAHDPYLERMTPALELLRSNTQETVILGKRQKDRILYLEVLESPQTIRYSARAGATKPLHSTCIGKVMLGALKPKELAAWLRSQELTRVTSNTTVSAKRLTEELEESAQRGYYMTRGENVLDVTAIAVPVRVNNELFGLAVAGPSHRMEPVIAEHAIRLFHTQATLKEQGTTNA